MQQINGGDGPPTSNPSRRHQLVPQLQFPPGFHFMPTDEELIDFYLRRKIHGQTAPLNVINEVDIMSIDPVKLIEYYKGYGENRWYFFTGRKPSKSKKQDEPNRKVVVDGVEEGSWSATGSVISIRRKATMDPEIVIGTKRVLTYKSNRSAEEDKWSMHEYVMADKSQMGQYVLCAIQLKQTYEAEKKAQEEGKISGTKRKRRATRKGKKNMQTTSQEQEEEHQEIPQPGEITGDPYGHIFDPSTMKMVSEDTPVQCSCGYCQGNNGVVQPADQTGYPAVCYNQQQQPMCLVDGQLMNISANYSEYHRNYQNHFYLEGDNGSSSSGEGLDQRHNTNLKTWENPCIYSGNTLPDGSIIPFGEALNKLHTTNLTLEDVDIYSDNTLPDGSIIPFGEALDQFPDGNMDDFVQDPFLGDVSIGETKDGTDFVLCDAFLANPCCGDASGQSMGIQHVAGHGVGDEDYANYTIEELLSLLNGGDSFSGSLPDGNAVGDKAGIAEGSNQGSLICQDGLQVQLPFITE